MSFLGPLLAAIPALAGVGASIYGASQGGDSPGAASFAATNPSAQFLASLFGGRFGTENNAPSFEAFKPGQSYEGMFPGSIFGPEQRQAIQDWLTPLPFSDIEQQAMNLFGEDVGQTYKDTTNFFDQYLMPAAQELVTTGFRTDIDPIREAMLRDYNMNWAPAEQEKFLGQTGSFASDWLGRLVTGGQGLYTDLGSIQAQLDEAAAQRRAAGLLPSSQLALTRQDLPTAVANSMLSFGGQSRLAQEALRPGGRVLDVLGILGGQGAPGQLGFVGSGAFPSQTSQLLAGLGQAAPAFSAASNLLGNINWGNWGGGGGNASSGGLNNLFGGSDLSQLINP